MFKTTEPLHRSRIFWLGTCAVGLAALNLTSTPVHETVQVSPRTAGLADTLRATQTSLTSKEFAPPVEAQRVSLDPARRNPFVIPPPAPPEPVAVPPPPPVVVAAPVPTAPFLDTTFVGRMMAPDGKPLIYVAQGDATYFVAPGTTLPNGYRVESITARSIELLYPPLGTTARIAIPAPPTYETR